MSRPAPMEKDRLGVLTRNAWPGVLVACALVFQAGCEEEPWPAPGPPRVAPAVIAAAAPPETVTEKPGGREERLTPQTFDDIKFDIEPDEPFDRAMLTDAIERLDGRRIRIRGWMLPPPRKKGLTEFVLVRDNEECCFGPGAALYDCIFVEMIPGRTAEYDDGSIAVEGRFSVSEFAPFDKTLAIYRIDGEKVDD